MQQADDLISTSLKDAEGKIDRYQERLEYLNTKRDKIVEEVEQLMASLEDVLQQKKEQLLDTLNELYSSERQKLLIDIRDKKALVLETKSGLSKVKELIQSGCDNEAAELARSLEQSSMWTLHNDDEPKLVDLNLNVNFRELTNAFGNLPYGDVDAVYDESGVTVMTRFRTTPFSSPSPLPSPSSLPSPSPSSSSLHSDECDREASTATAGKTVIITRTRDDKAEPKLNDIAVVEVGKTVAVVVTDRANKCTKSFYKLGDMRFYSRYSSPSPPRGIARVGNRKVGVTFPEIKSIRILKVKPVLEGDKRIKTSKGYRGIAMLDSEKLVVSTYELEEISSYSVDILDYKGNVLQSITTDKNGDNLFDYPFHLCTTPEGNIIVSDCGRKSITCLSETGNVIFRYGDEGDLKFPLGVTLDNYGDILVADCDNNKVMKILNDGCTAKEYLRKEDGMSGPYSLAVDADGTLYVIEWAGNIKVFNNN